MVVREIVEMKGGMWFELEGREEEGEAIETQSDPRMFHGLVTFVDIANDGSSELSVSVSTLRCVPVPDLVSVQFRYEFYPRLGHGLSSQQLDLCVQEFTKLVGRLWKSRDRSRRRRQFVFTVDRLGFWGSPYNARAMDVTSCVVSGGDQDCCAVCLGGFGDETACRLTCRHCFHGGCIVPWFAVNNTCPCCRLPFRLPPADQLPRRVPLSGASAYKLLLLCLFPCFRGNTKN